MKTTEEIKFEKIRKGIDVSNEKRYREHRRDCDDPVKNFARIRTVWPKDPNLSAATVAVKQSQCQTQNSPENKSCVQDAAGE